MPEISEEQKTPHNRKAFSNKTFLLVVVFIFAVVGLGTLVFFVQQAKIKTASDTTDKKTTQSNAMVDTKDWVIANKPGLGLLKVSFKHPSGWQTNSAANGFESCDAISITPNITPDQRPSCGSPNFSQVYIKPLTAGAKVRCKTETQTKEINGEKAIWCSDTISEDTKISLYTIPKGTKIVDYFFEGKSGLGYKGVSVWYTQEPGQSDYQKEFELLLGTLQFLECSPGDSYC